MQVGLRPAPLKRAVPRSVPGYWRTQSEHQVCRPSNYSKISRIALPTSCSETNCASFRGFQAHRHPRMPWHDVQICIGMWKEGARMKYILTCKYQMAQQHTTCLWTSCKGGIPVIPLLSAILCEQNRMFVCKAKRLCILLNTPRSPTSPFACFILFGSIVLFYIILSWHHVSFAELPKATRGHGDIPCQITRSIHPSYSGEDYSESSIQTAYWRAILAAKSYHLYPQVLCWVSLHALWIYLDIESQYYIEAEPYKPITQAIIDRVSRAIQVLSFSAKFCSRFPISSSPLCILSFFKFNFSGERELHCVNHPTTDTGQWWSERFKHQYSDALVLCYDSPT